MNLWVGTWERDGAWIANGFANARFPADAFRSAGEERRLREALRIGDDAVFKQVAVDRIREAPLRTIGTWATRYPRMWLGTRTELIVLAAPRLGRAWTTVKTMAFALNALTLVLAAVGVVLAVLRRNPLIFFVVPVLYNAGVYIPFHNVEPRYSLISLFFLYVFAALALLAIVRAGAARRRPAAAA